MTDLAETTLEGAADGAGAPDGAGDLDALETSEWLESSSTRGRTERVGF